MKTTLIQLLLLTTCLQAFEDKLLGATDQEGLVGGMGGRIEEMLFDNDVVVEGVIISVSDAVADKSGIISHTIKGRIEIKDILFSKITSKMEAIPFERKIISQGGISGFGSEPWSYWNLEPMNKARALVFLKRDTRSLAIKKVIDCSGEGGDSILIQVKELIKLRGKDFDLPTWRARIKKLEPAYILTSVLLRKVFGLPKEANSKLELFQKAINSKNEQLRLLALELAFENIEKNVPEQFALNTQLLTEYAAAIEKTEDASQFWDFLRPMDTEEFKGAVKGHPEWASVTKSMLTKTSSIKFENQEYNKEYQQEMDSLRKELLTICSSKTR